MHKLKRILYTEGLTKVTLDKHCGFAQIRYTLGRKQMGQFKD